MNLILDVLGIATGAFLIAAVVLALARLVMGPRLADRVIAFEVLTLIGIGAIAQFASQTQQSVYFPILIAWTIVSFLGTVAFARYIEKRQQDF